MVEDYPSDWGTLRGHALKRDAYRCKNCGSELDLNVHHIVPLSRGGTNHLDNLATLCLRCHSGVHPHMTRQHHTNGYPTIWFVFAFTGLVMTLIFRPIAPPYPPDPSMQQFAPMRYQSLLDQIQRIQLENQIMSAIWAAMLSGGLVGMGASLLWKARLRRERNLS